MKAFMTYLSIMFAFISAHESWALKSGLDDQNTGRSCMMAFPFFDDFESGLDNWLVSGQDWDTTSADYTGSGGHSVTDSPEGNYPAHSNASITLAHSIDLSSSNEPVLTFWHKFSTQNGSDHCRVEVSLDGGFTWPDEIENFTGDNWTWNRVQLDLSAYKMETILIRFRLTSNHNYQYDGWHIDDVEITEKDILQTAFPFLDDFESGLDNWLVSERDWDTTSAYHTGSTGHSVGYSPEGDYLPYTNASLTLAHPIDLSSSNEPVLTFWHKFSTQNGSDHCRVEVSLDGGFTWPDEIESFTGDNWTWNRIQLDLSAYKTEPILIRFRLTSNHNYQYDGWHIDGVRIREKDNLLTSLPFIDDFEGGLDNWLVSGQDWDTTSAHHTGDTGHSVGYSPEGDYLPYTNASLTLAHPIDLSSSNDPVLIFWHMFSTQDGTDYCRVEISQDGGFTWLDEDTSFTGNETWNRVQLDLSAYKSEPILIRFRLTSNHNYQYDGWHIDDVNIKDLNPDPQDVYILNSAVPDVFYLNQNYPNPFNPATQITYALPVPNHVTLTVYNVLGRKVQTLVSEYQSAGSYTVRYEPDDLASGVYFYQLNVGDEFVEMKKMLFIQ